MRKFVPKPSYNTVRPLDGKNAILVDQDLADAHRTNITTGISLMKEIRNDMEYGAGHRPSLPACFEDSEELGHVDPMTDIRVSKWDIMADECSILKRTPEPEPEPEPEPTPTE